MTLNYKKNTVENKVCESNVQPNRTNQEGIVQKKPYVK